VRFVTLTYGGWDHHDKIQDNMKKLVPSFDQAYAALIEDLKQRGMLEETLVCVTSEFGRSPKINANAGRDHWPKVFSSLLAGGGIKAGQVYGSSDATASEPADSLGINADKELMAPGARPVEIVDGGKVRKDLLV